jgi:hypothetical protein
MVLASRRCGRCSIETMQGRERTRKKKKRERGEEGNESVERDTGTGKDRNGS